MSPFLLVFAQWCCWWYIVVYLPSTTALNYSSFFNNTNQHNRYLDNEDERNSNNNNNNHVIIDSIIYFNGCTRGVGVADYIPTIFANIHRVASFWKDYAICIYADDDAANILLQMNHSNKLTIIYESQYPNYYYRTQRISTGRNACLDWVHRHMDGFSQTAQRNEIRENAYIMVMDLDDVNQYPFNKLVLSNALRGRHKWDLLSFNRLPYYDFWAVRYDGYDENILSAARTGDSRGAWMRFGNLKFTIQQTLDESSYLYFPVYSAFGGVLLVRYNFTHDCKYAWEIEGPHEPQYAEECEHVPFQKCMVNKYHARNRIFTHKLVNESTLGDFPAHELAHFQYDFVKTSLY